LAPTAIGELTSSPKPPRVQGLRVASLIRHEETEEKSKLNGQADGGD
jgi:hypothetical protein